MLLSSWLRKPADSEQPSPADTLPRDTWRALDDGSLLSFHHALPRLSYEVARARRYERPFTITMFTVDAWRLESEHGVQIPAVVQAASEEALDLTRTWASSAMMTVLLATLLRETLRESDIITYSPRFALCLVGLPETRVDGARAAVQRVQSVCVERLLAPIKAGVAEFPKSGWTLEDLIRHAETDALSSGPSAAAPHSISMESS